MFQASTWVVLGVALSGCAFGRHHGPAAPFLCRGRSVPIEWPEIRVSTAPVGRFELKVLEAPAAAQNGETYPELRFIKSRVQISADAVPIGTVAQRLSESLGLTIVVSPALVDLRVSISAQSITLDALLRALSDAGPLQPKWIRGQLILFSDKGAWDFRRSHFQIEDPGVQIIPVNNQSRIEQLAAMICDQILSERGSIAVVGDSLVVRDVGDYLTRARGAAAALDPPVEPTGETDAR